MFLGNYRAFYVDLCPDDDIYLCFGTLYLQVSANSFTVLDLDV